MVEHKEYDGRKVRIPNSTARYISPGAGKIGDVKWAGWDDWYYVFVDGRYYVKAQAHELRPNLVDKDQNR